MRYVYLFLIYLRVGVLDEAAYRSNFLLQLLLTLTRLGVALAGVGVIFTYTDALGSWGHDQLLALVGVHFLINGVMSVVILPSLDRLMQDIHQGTLDFVLVKPVDAQFLVSIRQIQTWKLTTVLVGAYVLVVALIRQADRIQIGLVLLALAALAVGMVIIYCFVLILSTCAFWFVRVSNLLTIFQGLYETGRWPIGIYPIWLRYTLTFVVPIAFAITVPAEAWNGRLTGQMVLEATGIAIVLLILSRWFWLRGIRYYSGASA